MGLIDGVVRSTERFIQVTWLEMASRRGTMAWMRRDHEVLQNFARTLASDTSSAPALRAMNRSWVRERLDAQTRGMERALYAPLEGQLPRLISDLRERRAHAEALLLRLESTATDSESFGDVAREFTEALRALFSREANDLLPAAIEHLTEDDYQALRHHYYARGDETPARQSA